MFFIFFVCRRVGEYVFLELFTFIGRFPSDTLASMAVKGLKEKESPPFTPARSRRDSNANKSVLQK